MKTLITCLMILVTLYSCNEDQPQSRAEATENEQKNDSLRTEVEAYLSDYTQTFQDLYYASAKAAWKLNTKIVEGDTTSAYEAQKADEAFAAFTGSEENIELSQKYLEKKDQLSDIQVKQLEAILYAAGANPQVAKEIVDERIKVENQQVKNLFGFDFTIDGEIVSANDIDGILEDSKNLDERLKAWRSSKEVGIALKDGLEKLRELRNKSVQALGYENYFQFQVSEYDMSSREMLDLNHRLIAEIWPLYRELHTWAKYELANRYNAEVPKMIPAHWLPNRWGQEWSSMVDVEGLNFDKSLEVKGAEWIMTEGEDFYVSLGYDTLPKSFYEKSSLYPLPKDAGYKKNNHASAWHLDLENDVRSLMSVEPNTRWWNTVLHELGHIYYYQAYSTDTVPILLRSGANRAYHEAIGTLIGLASMQKPFLVEKGLVEKDIKVDSVKSLLKEALDYIVIMPWASGVMTDFEHALYADSLPKDQFNQKWWELKKKYQGIVPPSERGEKYCDACSKTHIINDAAQYYDYALANVLLFQFHMYISENILEQSPYATNYYGSKETGDFLMNLMAPGATQDWRENLQQNLNNDISANAIKNYFQPLMDWLKKENKGREYSLPEKI